MTGRDDVLLDLFEIHCSITFVSFVSTPIRQATTNVYRRYAPSRKIDRAVVCSIYRSPCWRKRGKLQSENNVCLRNGIFQFRPLTAPSSTVISIALTLTENFPSSWESVLIPSTIRSRR